MLHYSNPIRDTDLDTLTSATSEQVAAWRWFAQYTGQHNEASVPEDAVVVGVDGAADSTSGTREFMQMCFHCASQTRLRNSRCTQSYGTLAYLCCEMCVLRVFVSPPLSSAPPPPHPRPSPPPFLFPVVLVVLLPTLHGSRDARLRWRLRVPSAG